MWSFCPPHHIFLPPGDIKNPLFHVDYWWQFSLFYLIYSSKFLMYSYYGITGALTVPGAFCTSITGNALFLMNIVTMLHKFPMILSDTGELSESFWHAFWHEVIGKCNRCFSCKCKCVSWTGLIIHLFYMSEIS